MADYIISCETTADLPDEYIEKEGIAIIKLPYEIDGQTYYDMKTLSSHDFYEKLHGGAQVNTSQANSEDMKDVFRTYLKQGYDILHIGFSSGLSGNLQSVNIAKCDLEEDEFPDRKIVVLDSLSASLGQGMLVYYANELKKQGKSIDEVAAWVEQNKKRILHIFTVDDLMQLSRGGRLSKGSAIVGGALGIKPILHFNDEGHLLPIAKEHGRKKALVSIANRLIEGIKGCEQENKTIMIVHADCIEDAEIVKGYIKNHFDSCGIDIKFMINNLCSVIGCHSGYKTVAVFGIGNKR